jgi:hypothetical protein
MAGIYLFNMNESLEKMINLALTWLETLAEMSVKTKA